MNEKNNHLENKKYLVDSCHNKVLIESDINVNLPSSKEVILKWSIYNFIDKISDNKYILYNCCTDRYIYIDESIKNTINECGSDFGNIKSINYELYSLLINYEFIVDEKNDEIRHAIYKTQNNPKHSESFELIINPTLDCNLRCWYCYESHLKKSVIDDVTFNSIKKFIRKKIESPQLKEILLSFFGGEPLLKFNDVIWPLIDFTQNVCKENKKKVYISFVTNGVLLTKNIVDKLYDAGLHCTFQVPFDGNKEFHNKTKKYPNGKGTYDKIIDNVMYALSKGNKFIIRCNYVSSNVKSFDELIDLFNEYAAECIEYGLLSFSYHRIWQVKDSNTMQVMVNKYEKKTNSIDLSFETCYADRNNSVVINYNGDIYKCTARDFKPEYREGYLSSDGDIIYNEIYAKRLNAKFINENCKKCLILPICNVCSQTRLESRNENIECLRFISENDKISLLRRKIEILLNE